MSSRASALPRRSPPRGRTIASLATLIALFAAGCGGGDSSRQGITTPPPVTTASLSLSQDTATLVPAATLQLSAIARDAANNPLTRAVTWASSDSGRATVSASGLVTANRAGSAVITATSEGKSAQAQITVKEGAVVSASGASVSALAGAALLEIGPGALAQPAMVIMESASPPSEPRLIAGTAVQISVAPPSLALPAALSLTYAPQNVPAGPPARLTRLFMRVGTGWTEVPNSTIDTLTRVVRADVTAGGTYGLLVAPFVASVTLSRDTLSLYTGKDASLGATARDTSGGMLPERDVAWRSSDPSVVAVDPVTGVLRAVGGGVASITATIEGKSATAQVTVLEPVASVAITAAADDLPVWGTRQLGVVLRDAKGQVVSGRAVQWSGTSEDVATISPAGVVTAMGPGQVNIVATSEGVAGRATLRVPPQAPVVVTAVAPATLTPGGTAVLTGSNFSPRLQDHVVTVGGVSARVTATSPTTLTLQVGATGYPCRATQAAPVVVTRGSGGSPFTVSAPLRVATPVELAVGQATRILGASEATCNEVALTGGAYWIAVTNSGATPAALTSYRLVGTPAPSGGSAALGRTSATYAVDAREKGARPTSARLAGAARASERAPGTRAAAAAHYRLLEEARDIVRRAGPPTRAWELARPQGAAPRARTRASIVPLGIGDTASVRLRTTVAGTAACSTFETLRVRTVAVNARVVVVEDVTAPLARQMDADYQALAKEFADVGFPLLTSAFGNPLAMDATLDADGRILVVFSPLVNARPVYGFVSPCDFYPQSRFASSNQAEVLYARVPTSASGTSPDARPQWLQTMRPTIVHEAKHIAALAERLSRGGLPEDTWLEEGMAEMAEELYARRFSGATWRGNAGFAPSLTCDVMGAAGACLETPQVMSYHFGALYDYLFDTERLSPLGQVGSGDGSFYGSAWALLRWSADHYARSEEAFLRALTQEPTLYGVQNLEARTERPIGDLLTDWMLALVADDVAGLTPGRPQLTFPSWNLADVYRGLNQALPQAFPDASPFLPFTRAFGPFGVTVPTLVGGTVSLTRVSGSQTAPLLLQLQSGTGGAPSASLRMSILRAQ